MLNVKGSATMIEKNKPCTPSAWDRQDPDKLMKLFSTTPVLRWIVVSVLAHILIIGLTSPGYILDHWIDPDGADARAARRAAVQAEQEETAPSPAETPEADAAAPAAGTAAGPQVQRDAAPVVRRITETPAAQDIPREPDDLGLSLEDTRL